jgi:hypothetical protein
LTVFGSLTIERIGSGVAALLVTIAITLVAIASTIQTTLTNVMLLHGVVAVTKRTCHHEFGHPVLTHRCLSRAACATQCSASASI